MAAALPRLRTVQQLHSNIRQSCGGCIEWNVPGGVTCWCAGVTVLGVLV